MQADRVEIVYRVKSRSCLYFEGFSEEIAAPIRVTSVTRVKCDGNVFVVPRIPGREIRRVVGVEDGNVVFSDLYPPCELLKRLLEARGVVELGEFVELRYVSFVDRVAGLPVRCYVTVVKPDVVFEGLIIIEEPCRKVGVVKRILDVLSAGELIVGGLRLMGCGVISVDNIALRVNGETIEGSVAVQEVLDKLCKSY
ncbi:hypothetical protein Pyrfu_1503 [Pyrolobus fumarii 1A]|uniref:Uncharacterized protein n=1 Tax=Pyrolobus fumarii (strain DSM 11204 / 1A) TaxID=694429 RepID=G0EHK8_PYRF1|nr:hypothetical protein [Pyrolobus fumarii]AEM39361.1 hypothetical protein Pyrfu_1503 [Pyrolobus fumarii 1A]